MPKFAVFLPKKQRAYKNESALLYQYANRACEHASALCRKRFSILDGPPYANGEIHVGHVLNKLLKQIITLAQTQMGKRSALKTNWDCHGLPIELKALRPKQSASASFLCRVYALNWIKTQIAQFKLIGLRCYKPQTSMSAPAQMQILNKLHDLVRLGKLALGRKPVVWALAENSSISEGDVEQKLDKLKLADVLNAATARKQTQQVKYATAPKLVLMQLSGGYKLLAKALLSVRSRVAALPWTACVSLPNAGAVKIYNTKTISTHRAKLANVTQIKRAPVRLITALNTLNVFNNANVPIANWQSDNAQTIDLTARPSAAPRLVCSGKPPRRDSNRFNTLARNAAAAIKQEISVVNKLITRSLITSCYAERSITLSSARSKGPAVNWLSTQLYIKLDRSVKASIANAISGISFYPEAHKTLLTNLIQTRPDWVVSRQRRWGVPLCMVLNARGKIVLDEKLERRVRRLFRFHRESQWHKLRTLRNKYSKRNWWQTSDVVDVWFDASSVYSLRAGAHAWDLVIEGIDQHRGWFQSTLINSTLTASRTPIKAIITHGFAMLNLNQKLSKSSQTQTAQTLLKQLTTANANAVRVWGCAIKPFENQIINANWLLKPRAAYIKINNTLKWGLSVALSAQRNSRLNQTAALVTPIDKLVLHKLRLYGNRIISRYSAYNLNSVLNTAFAFCDALLSSYFDVLKDQTYCDFGNAANRLNSIAVVRCAVLQVATWLTPVVPSVSSELRTQLKLGNNVINPLPSYWFNKRIASNWNVLSKLKSLAAKLRIKKKCCASGVCINIFALNKLELRALKNINIALALGFAKANAIWTDRIKPTSSIKLTKSLALSVWQAKLKQCARCKRWLYSSEY